MSASKNPSKAKRPVISLLIVIAIIVLLMVIITYVYFNTNHEVVEDVYFQDTRWGMTVEEVEGTMSMTTQSLIQKTDPVTMKVDIDAYEGISETNAKGFITYRFSNEGLLECADVSFLFPETTSDAFENQVISLFNQRYGECDIQKRTNADDSTNYVWSTEKSKITMKAIDPLAPSFDTTSIVFESES